jgi:uncharacterized protein (UPF0332 family)
MSDAITAASYMQKAQRALEAARLLLGADDTEGACNRAYYAMFDAAHAALWATGIQEDGAVIKTHSGLATIFGLELVKTGKVAAEHGRALGRVEKIRLLADYTADPPVEADAEESIALAEAFIAAMRRLIDEQP